MPTNGCRNSPRIAVPSLEPYLPAAASDPIGSDRASSAEMIMRSCSEEAARKKSHPLRLSRRRACPCRLRLARGTRAGLLRKRHEPISRRRIMPRPASSSGTPCSARAICCRPGRRWPQIDEQEQNLPALAGTLRGSSSSTPNDIAATTKLARIYLLGGANALDQALKLANQRRRDRSEKRRRAGAQGRHPFQAQGYRRRQPRGAGRAGDRPEQCRAPMSSWRA